MQKIWLVNNWRLLGASSIIIVRGWKVHRRWVRPGLAGLFLCVSEQRSSRSRGSTSLLMRGHRTVPCFPVWVSHVSFRELSSSGCSENLHVLVRAPAFCVCARNRQLAASALARGFLYVPFCISRRCSGLCDSVTVLP